MYKPFWKMNIRGFSHARITWNLDSSVYRYTIADGSWWIARAILHSSVHIRMYHDTTTNEIKQCALFCSHPHTLFLLLLFFFFCSHLRNHNKNLAKSKHIAIANTYAPCLMRTWMLWSYKTEHMRENREKKWGEDFWFCLLFTFVMPFFFHLLLFHIFVSEFFRLSTKSTRSEDLVIVYIALRWQRFQCSLLRLV